MVKYKQRRERERTQLRQNILDAARAIAVEEGWQGVTIRKVADRIEYSAPTIYEHFENKDAILLELKRVGFGQLLPALQNARVASADPAEQLRRMGVAYWDFAWDNPELYQVMHGWGGVPYAGPEDPATAAIIHREADEVFDVLSATLRDLMPASASKDDVETAGEIVWASIHGLLSLTMSRRIEGGRERGAQLTARTLDYLINGWRHEQPFETDRTAT